MVSHGARSSGSARDDLTESERTALREALRSPRGRYRGPRAAQLSGVPQRTVYHWASTGVLVPDFAENSPKLWSYRDLVLLRCLVWLRVRGFTPDQARVRINVIRALLARDNDEVHRLRAGPGTLLVADAHTDQWTGASVIPAVVEYLSEFDLLQPVVLDDIRARRMWGPHLVHPSATTSISPWVMSGEPCLRQTRLPTSTLFALKNERGLNEEKIVALYPTVRIADVTDAISLEERLRGSHAA